MGTGASRVGAILAGGSLGVWQMGILGGSDSVRFGMVYEMCIVCRSLFGFYSVDVWVLWIGVEVFSIYGYATMGLEIETPPMDYVRCRLLEIRLVSYQMVGLAG